MENSTAQILTPDQRLRVFVSSTLQELAEERSAVRQAIQNIHLTPVMFELGARPHAPRDLYRQYLAQSHIFIGIYWNKYGWVAPGESVSGLEDEYNLSGNMPKLIYIKKSSEREINLSELLARIQNDDKVSYKTFNTPEELADLIVNDLAVLLTERFNRTNFNETSGSDLKLFQSIPAIPNPIIGRDKNVEEVILLLDNPSIRLVTLTGPGGIGKTRLSIEIARKLQSTFRNGAAYVPLAPVKDHNLVAETICYALGIKITGGNLLENLKLFLHDKSFLLLLDNFEQVIPAASILDDLLFAAPGLKIIVTSRERLSLSFEHSYTVPALPDHFSDAREQTEGGYPAAIELFIQRAKAVQPSFSVTPQNKETIFKICHRLEGVPLAIELAAGQISLFSPALLLQKLERSFDVLKATFIDIPDRQKTIRNTIEWSFNLLSSKEQELLLQISLFNGGCQLRAIEAINANEEDVYETLISLINKSLLAKQDEDFEVRFQMLESVREFMLEKLKSQNRLDAFKQMQADFYHTSLHDIKLQKNRNDQAEILRCLEKEHSNIRQALDFLMENRDFRKIADIAWNLWLFWWVNAHTKEGYNWLKKSWDAYKIHTEQLDDHTLAILAANVGFMSFLQRDFRTYNESITTHIALIQQQDDDELIATTSLITGVVKTIMKQYDEADVILKIGLERFQKTGLTTGVSLVLSALGRNAIYQGGRVADAKAYYRESLKLARQDKNEISVVICLAGFALCEVMEKNSKAKDYLRESIMMSQSMHFYEALAWSMEIWSLVSINENKLVHAVTLMGAVDHLRHTTQLPVWDDLQELIINAKNAIEQQMDPEIFVTAWNEGAAMSLDKMVAFAMDDASPEDELIDDLVSHRNGAMLELV